MYFSEETYCRLLGTETHQSELEERLKSVGVSLDQPVDVAKPTTEPDLNSAVKREQVFKRPVRQRWMQSVEVRREPNLSEITENAATKTICLSKTNLSTEVDVSDCSEKAESLKEQTLNRNSGGNTCPTRSKDSLYIYEHHGFGRENSQNKCIETFDKIKTVSYSATPDKSDIEGKVSKHRDDNEKSAAEGKTAKNDDHVSECRPKSFYKHISDAGVEEEAVPAICSALDDVINKNKSDKSTSSVPFMDVPDKNDPASSCKSEGAENTKDTKKELLDKAFFNFKDR